MLFFFYYYSANGVLDEPYKYRLPFFQSFENNLHASEIMLMYQSFRLVDFTELTPSEKEIFILLYCLRYSCMQEVGRLHRVFRGRGLKTVNYEIVAQTFFGYIFLTHITKPFLRCYGDWLKFLGHFFFLHFPLTI